MLTIHRASLSGRTACGGAGRVSISGALVTCPKCLALQARPSREAVMQSIRAAAEARATGGK